MQDTKNAAAGQAGASALPPVAFIGGGNMAGAIIGGLVASGMPPSRIHVVEPMDAPRARLAQQGISVSAGADEALQGSHTVVWAVKPQMFHGAAQPVAAHTANALHLSVAAGIRSDSIARWLGTQRVVRCMPNTPALVGAGMTGLFAAPGATSADRTHVEALLASTGQCTWVTDEAQLDAVTALSGSGPAYVFYFLEAMVDAGVAMGLPADQARELAVGTFSGAAELARRSPQEPLSLMRERVTSKGGTTYAALTSMEQAGIKDAFIRAMRAAQARGKELGDEFGAA
ncbi:MAG: pyrroline-5-carboxylate reductase [Burkholderiaceae bacterium]